MTEQKADSVRLVVGIPSRGPVHIAWSLSYSTLSWPVNESRSTVITVGTEVATARNNIVKNAQEKGAEYLFFIDDDTTIPNYAPRRMIYLMEQNPDWDLLTGIYVTKQAPPEPLIFGGEPGSSGAYWDWRCGEIFPIWGCGMGCCLIRMSAFEKLEEPWFAWKESQDGINTTDEGEDLHFCRRLKEAGGTLMADGAVLCGHIDLKEGTMYRLWRDSKPFKNALPEFLEDVASGQVGGEAELSLDSPGGESKDVAKAARRRLAGVAGT